MAEMAMFPLGKVLLPGEVLPLHVFEPRYRQLVVDLLADDDHPPEFGVVLIERGWEVGGGDARADVGTVARLVDVRALEGGRYALVAVGVRRIRVTAWRDDDPYPRADVEDWPDGVESDDDLATAFAATAVRIRAIYERAAAAPDTLAEAAPTAPDVDVDPADPVLSSFRLAALAPIGPADSYRALCAPGPSRRLAALAASLDDVEAVLRFRLGDDG